MSIFDRFREKSESKRKAEKERKAELREVILGLQRNQLTIKETLFGKVSGPDASKLGGKPYLPADFAWPTYKSVEDGITRPLSFFCQFNLEKVKPYDKDNLLPARGMLYFFYDCASSAWGYDPADEGAARVFYFENTDGFVPLDLPQELAPEHTIPEIAIKFKPKKSFPDFDEFEFYSDKECDWDEYDNIVESVTDDVDEIPEEHKLLGYADVEQSEMLTECERISRGIYCGNAESYENLPQAQKDEIAKHAGEWTLLLQLSTIAKDDFEWMFGDCGMLYFYIRKADLAAGNFDRVCFVVQCC